MGRTHDERMRKVRRRQIINETAPSGEQTPILLALHRLTNAVLDSPHPTSP